MIEVYKTLTDKYDNNVNLHLERQTQHNQMRTQFEIGPPKISLGFSEI